MKKEVNFIEFIVHLAPKKREKILTTICYCYLQVLWDIKLLLSDFLLFLLLSNIPLSPFYFINLYYYEIGIPEYLKNLSTYVINMQLCSERWQKKHVPYEIWLIY